MNSSHEWVKNTRPWWWIINPWLYIKRRDNAYGEALDTIEGLSIKDESHNKECAVCLADCSDSPSPITYCPNLKKANP